MDCHQREVMVLSEFPLYEGLGSVKADATSTCQACGVRVPAGLDFCPVCALRGAVDKGRETVELDINPTPSPEALRFDHYELLTREDGTLLELGRGAMGVTYKAIDINLQCAVALKAINAEFIGDESARRRFVREARSAASVRHPNVASERRFQSPTELLKAVPTRADAIVTGRRITRLGSQEGAPHPITRRKPVRQGPKKISIARLPVTGSEFFGREEDIAFLD